MSGEANDAPLHEANRAAHRAARVLCNLLHRDGKRDTFELRSEDVDDLFDVAREYEAAQRRAQVEATR